MSATEFAFLALGLILGVPAGAALVVVLRSRSATPREVRLTVSRDSLPRRASTLSSFEAPDAGPSFDETARPATPVMARPDPDRLALTGEPVPPRSRRPVAPVMDAPRALALGLAAASPIPRMAPPDRSPVASPPRDGPPDGAGGEARPSRPPVAIPADSRGIPIEGEGHDPFTTRALAGRATAGALALEASPLGRAAVLVPVRTTRHDRETGPRLFAVHSATVTPLAVLERDDPAAGGPGELTAAGDPGDAVEACADERRIADERCAIAGRARAAATSAADTLHATQRRYDDHLARADEAERDGDPRSIRAAKETAQARFRAARTAGADPAVLESAAAAWLHEINRINTTARDAQAALERERDAVRRLVPTLERLAREADAARIGAESAEHACREAREATVQCEERAAAQAEAAARAPSDETEAPGPVSTEVDERLSTGPPPAEPAPEPLLAYGQGLPAIIAILRGDRGVEERLVATLARLDPAEGARWGERVRSLVDAIVGSAIEASFLDFPDGHLFWGPFTRSQVRDIVSALGSLGYRYDGHGGYVDGRVPGQRDLSLALGYAGLDPMRIRHWPTEAEMGQLFEEAAVQADDWLAGAAGELTLGEMVDALGRRADDLADVWNGWGRLRPQLLADA